MFFKRVVRKTGLQAGIMTNEITRNAVLQNADFQFIKYAYVSALNFYC